MNLPLADAPLRWPAGALIVLTFNLGLPAAEPTHASLPSGPYCGVYSLYTALKIEGIDVNLGDLLKRDYIGSRDGSTLPALLRAAQDHHAYAKLLTNLSAQDLRHLDCPVILHVKNAYDAPDYNHFVLCVPTSQDRLAVYDPPNEFVRSEGHELTAVWDGMALAVSSKPISLTAMRLWATTRVMATVGVACVLVMIVSIAQRRRASNRLYPFPLSGFLPQFVVIVLLASMLASGQHLMVSEGFHGQHEAVEAIRAAHFLDRIVWIDSKLARGRAAGGAQFVDARNATDFDQAHVPGALNVPPDSTGLDRARFLSKVPKNILLVVYCQSRSCPYAALLARKLCADGFTRVEVFGGGWAEWSAIESMGRLAVLPHEEG